MAKLLVLFLAVPTVELALLIEVGRQIGTLATLALIFFTALLGSWLARRQGLGVLRQMQAEMATGRLPAASIVDGVLILLAGAVLITPGILTDALGFLVLIPATRSLIKTYLWRRLERAVSQGTAQVHVDFGGSTDTSASPSDQQASPWRGRITDGD